MPTHRGQAVRSGGGGGQSTGSRIEAYREAARERRAPRRVTGMSAIDRAFPGNRTKQTAVWAAIRDLRSDRDSKLYKGSKASFLTWFDNKYGMRYPYQVPKRR